MKRSTINRRALRRAFLEMSSEWQTGRRNMPRGLVAACELAVALQVARFAAESRATKQPIVKP